MLVFVYFSCHITTYRSDSDLHVKGEEKKKKKERELTS